jgi:hypothetical protein
VATPAADPERLNDEGFGLFAKRAAEQGPVVMLNPSRQAFLDMIGSPEYQEIGHLRTEALEQGELHPMDAAGELP